MDDKATDTSHKAIITFLAVVIIAIVATVAVIASPKKHQTITSNVATKSTSTVTSTNAASLKNGSYTATGTYESPGGNESINIRVTLNNGVITATSATSGAQDPEAAEYQSMFIGGYKSQVIGKNIADVHLSRVSGSSLTSQGFNDAINQIENQAKA